MVSITDTIEGGANPEKIYKKIRDFHDSMEEIQDKNLKYNSHGDFTSEYALLDGLLYEYEDKFSEVL